MLQVDLQRKFIRNDVRPFPLFWLRFEYSLAKFSKIKFDFITSWPQVNTGFLNGLKNYIFLSKRVMVTKFEKHYQWETPIKFRLIWRVILTTSMQDHVTLMRPHNSF